MNRISVLFACDDYDPSSTMGGSKANAMLIDAIRRHPDVERVTTTKRDMPMNGHDLLIAEAPTGMPFVEACAPKYTYVLRHGDTPVGNCAYELFDADAATMIVPSSWAGAKLPRVPWVVQYMALEAPPGYVKPTGKKVLHARAFDFMKDTKLALAAARAAPELEFVFRTTPDCVRLGDAPPNVTLMPPVGGDELWDGIGCVLLTSRDETFSMIAYEAMCRGLLVVGVPLGAVREWGGRGWREALPYPSELAYACRAALIGDEELSRVAYSAALGAHADAMRQLDNWVRWAVAAVHNPGAAEILAGSRR